MQNNNKPNDIKDLVDTFTSDAKSQYDCERCEDDGHTPDGAQCPDCCQHEFDPSEGGMCLNCGREDYYNFGDEDYGRED